MNGGTLLPRKKRVCELMSLVLILSSSLELKGETEYTFNALPIGGFVRIYGENKEELGDDLVSPDSNRAFSSRLSGLRR